LEDAVYLDELGSDVDRVSGLTNKVRWMQEVKRVDDIDE
jgi:hypothetical protein